MMQSLKDLTGFEISALDGPIGHVREAYFDDARWVVRHVVVDTGGWLAGRRVLISPHAIQRIDVARGVLDVALSRQQIEQAPAVDSDRPVSRQYEIESSAFYGHPYYWGGAGLWGVLDMPLGGAIGPYTEREAGRAPLTEPTPLERERIAAEREAADPHLRSSAEVIGYEVAAHDGAIGHAADFLIDPGSWQIVMLVIDTHNWLPDRLVMLPPARVGSLDGGAHQVVVKMNRQAVKDSPPWDRHTPMDRDAVIRMQRHFEGYE